MELSFLELQESRLFRGFSVAEIEAFVEAVGEEGSAGPGETFGTATVFDEGSLRSTSIRALTPLRLFVVPFASNGRP